MAAQKNVAGIGVYSLPEAARLVKSNTVTVKRWLYGYRFPRRGGSLGESAPVFSPQLPQIENHAAIGFLDLIELLFIKAFRDEGVSLQYIRLAAKKLATRLDTTHPFCLKQFGTYGRKIFETVGKESGDAKIRELTQNQLAFKNVVTPYLKQFDFGEIGGVSRWWPLGKKRPVILDPKIAFGHPVVSPYGVPTDAIFSAVKANGSEKDVASWYDISISSVRAAVDFEKSRAA